VPTSHPRIQVTKDPALAAALARAERVLGSGPQAGLVRDLAIKGADLAVQEDERRRESMEYLVRISTERTGLDWDLLERIDEVAWRLSPPDR